MLLLTASAVGEQTGKVRAATRDNRQRRREWERGTCEAHNVRGTTECSWHCLAAFLAEFKPWSVQLKASHNVGSDASAARQLRLPFVVVVAW